MSTRARDESNESTFSTVVTDIFDSVRHSSSFLLVVFGAVLILIGYLLQDGVWAAIVPIWGAVFVLMGLVGYAYVWWTYRGG